MGLTITVDIGGLKVAAGVVNEDDRILARVCQDIPAEDSLKTEDVIAACIAELCADHEITVVGLGAAGFVDAARSTVLFAPNLIWRNEPLRAARGDTVAGVASRGMVSGRSPARVLVIGATRPVSLPPVHRLSFDACREDLLHQAPRESGRAALLPMVGQRRGGCR
jgi:ROK family